MENIKDKKYILFDLDGTLTDSYPAITSAFLYAASSYDDKITFSDRELSSVIGPPLKDSFQRLLGVDPFIAWELVLKYREFYNAGGMFNCRVYGGIEEALFSLKSAGKILAVATSKPEVQAVKILEHFNLLQYFEVVAGDDPKCTRSNKEFIIKYCFERLGITDSKEVVMVGDRSYDMIGASKVGALSVGVTFGYGSESELMESGANYIVKNAKELKELLI